MGHGPSRRKHGECDKQRNGDEAEAFAESEF